MYVCMYVCMYVLYATSIRDFFYPENNSARLYLAAASQPRVFARLLVGNYYFPLALCARPIITHSRLFVSSTPL